MKTEEGKNVDYKLTLDLASEKEKVEIIKEIVAFANSGGGKIIFGQDNQSRNGVDSKVVDVLDSAKCCDQIRKYAGLEAFELKHETESLPNGKFIHILVIPRSRDLIVMSRDGAWKGSNPRKDRPLFAQGDIWVRHSSKTEKISNEDVRAWSNDVRTEEREKILSRFNAVARLPDGFEVVAPTGKPIQSPKDLLANACSRRKRDPAHLLNGDELLWVFQNRVGMTFHPEELAILLASALRRNATLYWWLTVRGDPTDLVMDAIFGAISGTDRDKSDAAHSILELAAIYADEKNLREILKLLRNSRYAHFRSAAESWSSRSFATTAIVRRIKNAKVAKVKIFDVPIDELATSATQLASQLYSSSNSSRSKHLGWMNRVIWYKLYGHLMKME